MPDVRLGHGVFIRAGLDDDDTFAAGLEAWRRELPPSAVFTSLTAARAHGLWLPPLPSQTPWFVAMGRDTGETVPVRPELHVTRPAAAPASVGRVTSVAETLLACARDCALLDVIVLVDAALQQGLVDLDAVVAAARPRLRGSPRLRAAVALADGRSESPWESLLRVLHVSAGIAVEPQAEIVDEHGRFVARADLLLTGARTLHEYDGAGHREAPTHRRDLARERRLVGAGYARRGFVAADLLRRPHRVIDEACASIGVPFTMDRIDPWLRLVGDSLFTAGGQRRALRRWLRSETVGKHAKALRALG